ncbi:MAG: sodium:solute symporter [Verrucomicrobiota bacterium]
MNIPIRFLDVAVIAVYIAAIVAIGRRCARRSRSAENYFVGHRSFPGWAVALSMMATIVSSSTFLALPAAAYVLDWRQLTVNLVVPLVAILAAAIFIPFFRRAGLTSAFEYLGDRFGHGARLYAAVSFVILQLLRLAMILFLVAIPLQFLTGVPMMGVILGCGVFVALYAVAGGMETVFWTGVVQALIKVTGGVLCLVFALWKLPGGMAKVLSVGNAYHKFSLGSLEWNVHERTFYTVAILGLVNWLMIFVGEQTMVQRYVSASSLREARKATLMFAGIAVPLWTMFFLIGTTLFVLFQVVPDAEVAKLQPDQVLAYFVLRHMPVGIAGVVIAAVLAAAMGSLDSGVNSVSSVVVVDLLRPYLARNRSDVYYLKAARVATGMAVALMTVGALAFTQIQKECMNDVSLTVSSVFGGCVMGLYMVGFFVPRVDGRCVNTALVVAIIVNAYLGLNAIGALPAAWRVGIHSYWTTAVVNVFFILVACGLSLLSGGPSRNLRGLTVWTAERREPEMPCGAAAVCKQ